MRRFRLLLSTLLALLLAASMAPAQGHYPIPQAPDMCGPGFYAPNCCGHIYGPGYCIQPPYPPFQGMVFGPKNPCPGSYAAAKAAAPGNGAVGSPTFPTHPYSRSPRDFFMIYDQWEPIVPGPYVSPTPLIPTAPAIPYAVPPAPGVPPGGVMPPPVIPPVNPPVNPPPGAPPEVPPANR